MIDNKTKEAYKEIISEAILDKKGQNITILDFENIENSPADLFIICDANSTTHQNSIKDSIDDFMRNHLGEKPNHVESNSENGWVLIDYVHVVIHVFLPNGRDFYQLEELWADCTATYIKEKSNTVLN